MIGLPAALFSGSVLVLLLFLLAKRSADWAQESTLRTDAPLGYDETLVELCPPEFVARIFSPEDWAFVLESKSPQLEKLFHRERKLVALAWVRQTATAIRRIMREHTEAARQSQDLQFATEAKLVFLYAQLMFLCGMLYLAIQSAGPRRVYRLAGYADTLSQRLAQAQQDLKTATVGPQLQGVRP